MDVGMIIQASAMRMQHCGHADVGAKIFGIQAKIFQCAGSTRKKKVINKGLVIPRQESQLIGKRKGDHEVFHRQELLLPAIEPKGSLMIPALRAVAVAAGTGPACGVTAFCALNEYLTGLRRPASSDRCDGLQMAG
jgi:hypothetical protein